MRSFAALLACSCLSVWAPPLDADPPSAGDLEFFETKIRPVLVENCFKCHAGSDKVKGGLHLDSRAAILKGGESGPAVVPGDPAKSRLIKAVGYEVRELRMPPRGRLPAHVIEDLTEWVRRGVPWPDEKLAKGVKKEFDLKERSKHWSLQPLATPALPPVAGKAWPKNGVDHFILAGLEAQKLMPAAAADKLALLRRVSFDLIGLPPTPEEIDAFLKDDAADAYEKVVDRLLASPHYGERWARHWLDLVRYAETQGHEFDFDIPDAWQYRDYAIRAFNEDVPFNQLVTEHIAGDLLPAPRRHPKQKTNESVLGTMFWLLGEAKHSPVDSKSDYADRLDNQIDVFGKAFLGMTIACARCHDHKFDAISTKDYYSLMGYLLSSRPDKAVLDDSAARWSILKRKSDLNHELQMLAARQTVEQLRLRGPFPVWPLQELLEDPEEKARRPKSTASFPRFASPAFRMSDDDYRRRRKIALGRLLTQKTHHERGMSDALVFADAQGDRFAGWMASGESFALPWSTAPVTLQLTRLDPVARLGTYSRASSGVSSDLTGAFRSPTFTITKNKIHYRAMGKDIRINLILDGLQLIRDPIYGGLSFTVTTKELPTLNKKLPKEAAALEATENRELKWYTQDVSMWRGHRAYIEVIDDGAGYIVLDQVLFSDEAFAPPEPPNELLLDLLADPRLSTWDRLQRRFQHLVDETMDLWQAGRLGERRDFRDRARLINGVLDGTDLDQIGFFRVPWNDDYPNHDRWEDLADRFKTAGDLSPPPRALALCDGSAVNERVFIRGNPKNLGAEAPRRFLEVFSGKTPDANEMGSGRLELARHMTDPAKTPILPRVFVNRLWKHHFGEGIVRSVDDFGVLGQTPSHPELLDWLANELIKNDWSIKQMHRLMVRSATYRMSSKADEAADRADADNRLWHKMPLRRLEAEAIRDAMLAVSGRLERTMFGPPVPPHLTPHMQGRGRPSVSGPLDGAGRRSIYLGVRRNFLNPMFLAFDFPTPFSTMGRRGVSNVPAQALTMLNNPLVLQQAELWAKKVLAEKGLAREKRIERMYLTALGRLPQPAETQLAVEFLEEQSRALGRPDDPAAWTELAHVMCNLKEFIFIP